MSLVVGTSSWREQFIEAVTVSAGKVCSQCSSTATTCWLAHALLLHERLNLFINWSWTYCFISLKNNWLSQRIFTARCVCA